MEAGWRPSGSKAQRVPKLLSVNKQAGMFNLQKQGYQEPKNRINTVILSLRKQGSIPVYTMPGSMDFITSLHDRGQPDVTNRSISNIQFFPCVTGVNLNICVLVYDML